jgi:predicted DNA-binding protein (MmcQ/YjbR family)
MASAARARSELRKLAFSLPGAWEDHPWGEDVAKVGTKVFVSFGREADFGIGVKLDRSRLFALTQPGVKEMGYGLGRSGWVEVRVGKGDIPLAMYREWILESYELVAPKQKVTAAAGRRTRPSASSRPSAGTRR